MTSPLASADIAGPRTPPAAISDEQALDAVRMPAGLGTPLAYALGSEPFLVIVNDHHRPTPTAQLLDWLDAHLAAHGAGLLARGAAVLVATGSHAAPTNAELASLLGHWAEPLQSRGRVRVHDATATSRLRSRETSRSRVDDALASPDLLAAGRTRRGTPLHANAALAEYPNVVSLNSVEPHYFAGYTGTRKSIFPGATARASIEANHRLALEPGVAPRVLDGNPVAEDLAEGTARILRASGARGYAFNVVSVGGSTFAAASGTLDGALRALAPAADAVFGAPIVGDYDVVVARAHPPYSRTLYQCMKAFEHGRLALRDGGALVLDAACDAGLGPFQGIRLLQKHGSRDAVVTAAREHYVLGAHQPARLFQWLAQGNRAYFATPGLAADDVRALGAEPVTSAEDGVVAAARDLGVASPRVLVLEDATNVVPLKAVGTGSERETA